MTIKSISFAFVFALIAFIGIGSVQAAVSTSAAVNANVGGTVNTNATVKASTQPQKIITRGDSAIDARVKVLNTLNARIGEMKNVSDTEKSAVSATVQTNISGLTALKTKIDGETDAATLASDEKTITGSFRIYALILPQGNILASADRAVTIAGLLSDAGTKLQTRLADAQTAGNDVSAAMKVLTDMSAQITAANTESSAAAQGVVSLTPDQGDKTKAEANHAALVAARAHMKTATTDLGKARDDAKKIIKSLGSYKVSASTTAATSVQ